MKYLQLDVKQQTINQSIFSKTAWPNVRIAINAQPSEPLVYLDLYIYEKVLKIYN